MIKESISLYFKNEKSDKFYNVAIEESDDKFSVPFTYGRQGSSGQSGKKVSDVPYEVAKKAYDKVIKQKMGKGYLQNTTNTTTVHAGITDNKIQSGIYPQLLCPIKQDEIDLYLKDDRYGAQEKKDGVRKFLHKKEEEIVSINRTGFEVGFPTTLKQAAETMNDTFLIDGEEVGDTLYVFDIFTLSGMGIKDLPYLKRYNILKNYMQSVDGKTIQIVPLAIGSEKKLELYNKLKKENKEGIVFKLLDAPYEKGRISKDEVAYEKNCPQVKCKFYATASCIVTKENEKRSVAISMFDGDNLIDIGNCAIPVNKEIPAVDSIIEVRYLYCHKGGSLYQPTYIMPREDIEKKDCTITQLKYKPE